MPDIFRHYKAVRLRQTSDQQDQGKEGIGISDRESVKNRPSGREPKHPAWARISESHAGMYYLLALLAQGRHFP